MQTTKTAPVGRATVEDEKHQEGQLYGQVHPTVLEELTTGRDTYPPALIEAQAKHIRSLQRKAGGDPRAKLVADELANCAEQNPCLSGACLRCATVLQRKFARAAYAFMRENFNRPKNVVVVSLVSYVHSAPVGQLGALSPANVLRDYKEAFDELGIDLAIGGLDYSVEVPLNGNPRWQIGLWIFVPAKGRHRWEPSLRERVPAGGHVLRPVKLNRYDGNRRATLYAVKPAFDRNERYLAENTHRDDRGPCQNTRKRPLQAAERLELLLHLHQEGLASRLFLHGVKLKDGNGVKLVRTTR